MGKSPKERSARNADSEPASDAERWDQRYRGRCHDHGRAPVEFLREIIERLGAGRALDLAMGEGRNAVYLAECGYEVTGIDISPVAVERARELASERGVEIDARVADLTELEFGHECFELITSFYYLERSLFPKIIAALAPAGLLVVEHFSTDHPAIASFGPRNLDYLLAPNELIGLVAGLRILHYEDRVVEVEEGRHQGPAALVRLIARKE